MTSHCAINNSASINASAIAAIVDTIISASASANAIIDTIAWASPSPEPKAVHPPMLSSSHSFLLLPVTAIL